MSVSIKLKKDQLKYLGMLAEKNGKTIDHYISEAVDKYLEDEYFTKLADERYADILSGKEEFISYEEAFLLPTLSISIFLYILVDRFKIIN